MYYIQKSRSYYFCRISYMNGLLRIYLDDEVCEERSTRALITRPAPLPRIYCLSPLDRGSRVAHVHVPAQGTEAKQALLANCVQSTYTENVNACEPGVHHTYIILYVSISRVHTVSAICQGQSGAPPLPSAVSIPIPMSNKTP